MEPALAHDQNAEQIAYWNGPGGDGCGPSIGATARTNFILRGGLIVTWLRAPDQPGDSQIQSQTQSHTQTELLPPLSPATSTGPSGVDRAAS